MTSLPNVRQLEFSELVDQARAEIPKLCPEWTHHGAADPGITLIELVASFAEMLTYRASRQTDAITRSFLELLSGEESARSGEELRDSLHRTLAELWTRYRAVTCSDYCHLALEQWAETDAAKALGAAGQIHRVHCLAERHLASSKPLARMPGHVSVIVVPKHADQPSKALRNQLWQFYEPRRLLTTRHHVVGPRFVEVNIQAKLFLQDGASRTGVVQETRQRLIRWFDPHTGGEDNMGWPFGGNIYLSSIYREIDKITGVDFVKDIKVTGPHASRTIRNSDDEHVGITIYPHELVRLRSAKISLSLHEFAAGEWREVQA